MLPLQSENIDKLTEAFIAARMSFKEFNAETNSRYDKKKRLVSIDDCREATEDALFANGISLTQQQQWVDGMAMLETKYRHTSGQWEASYAPLNLNNTNPGLNVDQIVGTSMSYQRRYALYGLFCIKGEDLDPDFADATQSNNAPQANSKPDYSQMRIQHWHIDEFKKAVAGLSAEDQKSIEQICLKKYGVQSMNELKQFQFHEYMKEIE